MGHTYRKEKNYDDKYGGHKHKKLVNKEVDRKQNKNHRFIDVLYEDDDYIEYEDEYEEEPVQYNRKK